ncbi:4-hydroxy-3-methylbut-2-enyl diphosphate reductase [Massilicoli timonensis]|uniref:4-hydroxy-3-methylbut-2-enyl diphosphate reductase n=2 Tax=Massilicoli timonensis TaxID=2015901 RepID=UPI000C818239|nr:4-hydroxy-3-methylbut-2-enyl diphosphate reductase [Massilicoli timonensis]
MELIKVTPRGYCKGVVRAISMAKQARLDYPNENIYVLGMLVHNHHVVEALKRIGIIPLDEPHKTRAQLLERIDHGVVIFTAHGVSPQVINTAKAKGLICLDATCPDVLKTQAAVIEHLEKGYEVLYIGKLGHPEAEAICSLSPAVHLIENEADLKALSIEKPLFVTNQTTMSVFDIESLFQTIKAYFPTALFCEEICNATRIRQEAIARLKDIDVLYVVGDRFSNNSNRLAQIAKEHGIPHVYLIDDVFAIHSAQLKEAKRVAVTSGASTPTYVTNQVIDYLEHYEENKKYPVFDLDLLL